MIPENLTAVPLAAAVEAAHSAALTGGHNEHGELTLLVKPESIVDLCRYLKQEHSFVRLSGITGVDWWPDNPRFEVVYLLHSLDKNARLRLKFRVNETDEVDSVTSVWRSANWYEREVFDMFGVKFRNHPDMRRILLPSDWEGHPLRKDFPVHGHKYSYQNE